MFDIVAIAAD